MSGKKKKIRLVIDSAPILKANQRAYLFNKVIYDGCENICKYCNKSYQSISLLEKHALLCKLKYDIISNNQEVVPTPRTMYLMILELTKKHEILENKYKHLNLLLSQKKKKINLTEWLNHHIDKPVCDNYMSYFDDKFEVSFEDIDILFNTNYNDFFNILLQKMNFNGAPIISFTSKSNSIYGYIDDKWCDLTKVQLSSLFFRCKKTIFSKSFELKTLKKDKIAKCEKLEAKFDRLMLKLINAEMIEHYNKLRLCLYNNVKKDITNITDYDLEFD